MIDELKPVRCGCGGEAKVLGYDALSGDHDFYVNCTKCGICTPSKPTKAEAIETWNTAMGERTAMVIEHDASIATTDGLEGEVSGKKRTFLAIDVSYPKICTYPEYEGKPYYGIKYLEEGETILGFGTYKPEVLSEYLRNYFIPSAEPERPKGRWIPVDSYSAFGGDEATWMAHGNPVAFYYCSNCKNHAYALEDGEDLLSDFCPNCGADMSRGES